MTGSYSYSNYVCNIPCIQFMHHMPTVALYWHGYFKGLTANKCMCTSNSTISIFGRNTALQYILWWTGLCACIVSAVQLVYIVTATATSGVLLLCVRESDISRITGNHYCYSSCIDCMYSQVNCGSYSIIVDSIEWWSEGMCIVNESIEWSELW